MVIWLTGCKPESPEARLVWGVKAYNVGGPSYSRIFLVGGNAPGRCETEFAAQFIYADGTPVAVGGLRFHNPDSGANFYVRREDGMGYWVATDKAGTASTLATNEAGFGLFTSWCEHWGVRSVQTSLSAGGRRTPQEVLARAGYENLYDSLTGHLIAWYGHDSQWPSVRGGHYQSGGYSGFQSVSESHIQPPRVATYRNTSVHESGFLDDDSVASQGAFEVVSAQWQRRAGQPGEGYSVEAEHLTLLEHSDTSTLQYLSTPYFLSVSVVLAEPVDASIVGLSVPAELTAGGACVSPITVTVAALSADGKRLVIQSDYIIPIDTRDFEAAAVPEWVYDRWTAGDGPDDPAINIYAPLSYAWDDPNHVVYDPNSIDHNYVILSRLDPQRYIPVVCVPMSAGERLQIKFTDATLVPLIPFFSEKWLMSCATMDLNGDGIVNFEDAVLFMKEVLR